MVAMLLHFLGCSWCNLRVFGCRCASPCDAAHCDRRFRAMPAVH